MAHSMYSSSIQYIARLTPQMSHTLDENYPPLIHRREVPEERGDRSVLRYFQVVSKQRCFPTADGIPGVEGASWDCR